MIPVDLDRCLAHLDRVERARALGELLEAEASLDRAIQSAPGLLLPYLKLGRERFVEDAIAAEPSLRRALRSAGLVTAAPKLKNRARRSGFPPASGEEAETA